MPEEYKSGSTTTYGDYIDLMGAYVQCSGARCSGENMKTVGYTNLMIAPSPKVGARMDTNCACVVVVCPKCGAVRLMALKETQ